MSDSLPTPPPLPIAPPPMPVGSGYAPAATPSAAPLSTVRWPIALMIFLLVLNVASLLGIGPILRSANIADVFTPDGTALVTSAVMLAQYLLPLLAAVAWARTRGASFSETLLFQRFDMLSGIGMAVGFAFFGRFVGIWYVSVTRILGISAPTVPDLTRLFPLTPIGIALTVLVAVVIAPIAEEALFRGILFAGLRDRLGVVPGMAISAAIFAGVHFSLYQFVPLFLLGLMLSYLVTKTRSVWPSIACHAMYNGTAVGLLYLFRALGVGS